MKRKFRMIEESLDEFSARVKKHNDFAKMMQEIDATDSREEEEEEPAGDIDVDSSDMESAEEIEVDDTISSDELETTLNNELKIPEFSRSALTFHLAGDLENVYNGIPMAKMSGGSAFLFKLEDGKLKKIYLKDIVLEQKKGKSDRAYTINE